MSGDVFDLSTKCLAPEGRLLVIGFAGGRISSIAANRMLLMNISIVGVLWGAYIQEHPTYPAEVHAILTEWYTKGPVHPVVGACAPFEHAPRALLDLAARKVAGKAVLSLPG